MERGSNSDERRDATWPWPFLIALTLVQMWAAHAVAFFAHELAHSTVAWALGWKATPWTLHYPSPSIVVFLLQLGINQDVNEAPIFAGGHGVAAAVIAAAGMIVGNAALTFPLSRLGYRRAERAEKRGWAMFAYWVSVASVGNLIDYVPIRTFTLDGDMGSVQRGLGWSPWTILVVFGIPSLVALAYLLGWIVPSTLRRSFPRSVGRRFFVASLTVFVLFGFYGAAGLLEGGPVSHSLSVLSLCIALPLALVLELYLVRNIRERRPR